MAGRIDLTGQRFGRLVVLEFGGLYKATHSKWKCRCDCGKEVVVFRQTLVNGSTRSCGCFQRELVSAMGSTHRMSKTRMYKAWHAMKSRCLNENNTAYAYYGGRGIKCCQRWSDSFEAFLSDMGTRPRGATIERIDNDSDYCPENCRWATRKEQQRNRRGNNLLECNGETLCIMEWSERYGINFQTICGRLQAGWSPEDAVTKPVNSKNRNKRAKVANV